MGHLDEKQIPIKSKPWKTIADLDFIQRVELLAPAECLPRVDDFPSCSFSRVVMKLGEVLDGNFFTDYVKTGNVMMLSQGRSDADNVFTLKDGLLTLYLDRETYERAGLIGAPFGVKGNRGLRPRWIVQYQLRDRSMLHGKKGFDRLLYACRNVLNTPVAWLFANLNDTTPHPEPLAKHSPTSLTSTLRTSSCSIPDPDFRPSTSLIANGDQDSMNEWVTEMYEWIALTRLGSPIVDPSFTEHRDSNLYRYEIPSPDKTPVQIERLCWQGFLSSQWVQSLLKTLVLRMPAESWFSLSINTFPMDVLNTCSETTFLRLPQSCGAGKSSTGEFFLWEVKPPE